MTEKKKKKIGKIEQTMVYLKGKNFGGNWIF